jgi:hypothetical protein
MTLWGAETRFRVLTRGFSRVQIATAGRTPVRCHSAICEGVHTTAWGRLACGSST